VLTEPVDELVKKPAFADYQLRVTDPQKAGICDPAVKQRSGYLDVTDGKHLFYWFFESRTKPEDAPLILWINGGPGCSSQAGLLFELGPCSIANDGKNTTFNPHSWNTHANIIFLDQPVNVGYSYSDDGSTVNNSPVAGKDVHAFLQLFLQRFPQYVKAPFHLAAESYGGTVRQLHCFLYPKSHACAVCPEHCVYYPHCEQGCCEDAEL
jgi:cathepsin A (carboxypeptidase C)